MKTELPLIPEGQPREVTFWNFVRWCVVNNDPPLPKSWTKKPKRPRRKK